MKAVIQRRYGEPEKVLEVAEVAKPDVADDHVLVKVVAASLHPDVWHVIRGLPRVLRVMGSGLRRPRVKTPGTDMAGVVESSGTNATRFSPGDAVYGETIRGHQWKNGGAFAEYVAVPESALAPKPDLLSFSQAAAIPTSGFIAYQNMGHLVGSGDRVLVNGAAGGVGMLVVQIARAAGAHVTGVDRTDKLELMKALGANEVVDYTAEDFTAPGPLYDLIVDIPGNRSFEDLKRVMADGGNYVLIGHEQFGSRGHLLVGTAMARFLRMGITAPFGRRQSGGAGREDRRDHKEAVRELVAAGDLTPIVDPTTFGLGEVPAAVHHMEQGQAKGKIVITVS